MHVEWAQLKRTADRTRTLAAFVAVLALQSRDLCRVCERRAGLQRCSTVTTGPSNSSGCSPLGALHQRRDRGASAGCPRPRAPPVSPGVPRFRTPPRLPAPAASDAWRQRERSADEPSSALLVPYSGSRRGCSTPGWRSTRCAPTRKPAAGCARSAMAESMTPTGFAGQPSWKSNAAL